MSAARLLAPVGRLYGSIVESRYRRAAPLRVPLPVICIGNFTAGGAGKTPLALQIARRLVAHGERPVFLARGYGGRQRGPAWVDRSLDTARDVGDEPLLLSGTAPTVVSRDRKAGAELIAGGGKPASVIIMDDGLQNPAIAKDLTIAVVDGRRGFGNGGVMPAGPLRAPLEFQLGLVDAIVVNGATAEGEASVGTIHERLRRLFPGPVLQADVAPSGDTAWLQGARVVAFAGIGVPERFFTLLERLGAVVVERRGFADHRAFSGLDAAELLAAATRHSAQLVTTEKDMSRLLGATGRLATLREAARVLPVAMIFGERDAGRLEALIGSVAGRNGLIAKAVSPGGGGG